MALAFLPEEEIRSIYLLLELPLAELLDSEKELVRSFRNYFNKTWITGNINFQSFIMKRQRIINV